MLNALPTPYRRVSIRWLAVPAALLAAGVLAVSANAASGGVLLQSASTAACGGPNGIHLLPCGQQAQRVAHHLAPVAPLKPSTVNVPRMRPGPSTPAATAKAAALRAKLQTAWPGMNWSPSR